MLFVSLEEKVQAVRSIHKATRSSIEQKRFKKYQFLEALGDPVSWHFCLAAFTLMISNNLQFQQNLIFLKIGVWHLGSTLVSVAGGGFAVVCAVAGAILMKSFQGSSLFGERSGVC